MKLYKYNKEIKKINENFDFSEKTGDFFKNKTKEFIKNLNTIYEIRKKEQYLNEILPECFAMVREVSSRVLKLRHFDVQLMGGIIIHEGNVAEMKTGEGKTLVITLSAYLNALLGKGVHVITVNDYLAKRDKEQMSKIYEYLGLSVGLIQHSMSIEERRLNYNCDITYVNNQEIVFDYLRSNLAIKKEEMYFPTLNYAIIDEVDSILIDEAKTPLIISSNNLKDTKYIKDSNSIVKTFKVIEYNDTLDLDDEFIENNYDVVINIKEKSFNLTKRGITDIETYYRIKNISDLENSHILHYINNAIMARFLLHKNKDYIVKNKKIEIIDEYTGRILEGRQYSNELHQAIECKENLEFTTNTNIQASITYQSFFKLYYKLSGITGTALTSEEEFKDFYNLKVIEVPTNKPIIRIDHNDKIFLSKFDKYNSIVNHIKQEFSIGRPVLVGTPSIEISEIISNLLSKENIPHNVLNAKFIEQEADIISHAGQINTVTVATNMAGRGTDIVLSEESKSLGGLLVIGVERNISRRIDNQLIGRAGRQGDVGESIFYISFEDDLLKYHSYDYEKLQKKYKKQSKRIDKEIFRIQKTIDSLNLSSRKNLLKFNDIISLQMLYLYSKKEIIINEEQSIKNTIYDMLSYCTLNMKDSEIIKYVNSLFKLNLVKKKKEKINLENIFNNDIINLLDLDDEKKIKIKILSELNYIWSEYLLQIESLKLQTNNESFKQQDPFLFFNISSDIIFKEILINSNENLIKSLIKEKPIMKISINNKYANVLSIK